MNIPDTPIPVRPEEFSKLLEFAHELSNSVGLTMNLLVVIPADLPQPAFDRLATAMEQATKATCTLRKLMWQLGEICHSAQTPKAGAGESKDRA